MLQITEIYKSVQGESRWAGWPCTFIRLTGCPLRCRWCDTVYSFKGGEKASLTEIADRVQALGSHMVELTGGEPLAQDGSIELMQELIARGHQVLIETSGAECIEAVPDAVHIVMDIKCPDSGMSDRNRWSNIEHLADKDEVKFVVASRADFDWAHQITMKHQLLDRCPVSVSPAWGLAQPRDVVEWILESGAPYRLNMQIHKTIWSPKAKGV